MAADLTIGTAVAYCPSGSTEVKSLGWGLGLKDDKVPTRLFYKTGEEPATLLGWGSSVPAGDPNDVRIEELFKTEHGKVGSDRSRIERLFVDYLRCLFDELSTRFKPGELGGKRWGVATIQFLFSTPATWEPRDVDHFTRFASQAGFDKFTGHTIAASLTEPQAVAAFQLCSPAPTCPLKDFCLLRVRDDGHGNTQGVEPRPVAGKNVGSVNIDWGFERLVSPVLKHIAPLLAHTPDHTGRKMRRGGPFQRAKHEFGIADAEFLPIKVPGLKQSESSPHERITREAAFQLSQQELRDLFDNQVYQFKEEIKKMVDDLTVWSGHSDNISKLESRCLSFNPAAGWTNISQDYLLLSGGLGSSRYVKRELEGFCASGQLPLLETAKVVLSDEPLLSVCQGLVHHALRNPKVLPRHRYRLSFGIACRVSTGRSVEKHLRDIQKQAKKDDRPTITEFGKTWFVGCVDWFISKGTLACDTGVVRYPHYAIFPADTPAEKRICQVKIVTSPKSDPPPFGDVDDTHSHGTMKVDLSLVGNKDIVQMHDMVWHKAWNKMRRKKSHVKVEFDIEAEIGPASVNFQCFDKSKSMRLSQPLRLAEPGVEDEEEDGVLPVHQGMDDYEE
ncbi:hypothetical protein ACHAPT_012547 [Fusarium lateritium]